MFDTIHDRGFACVSNWSLKVCGSTAKTEMKSSSEAFISCRALMELLKDYREPNGRAVNLSNQSGLSMSPMTWTTEHSALRFPICSSVCCLKGLLWILKYTSDIHSSSIWRHIFSKGHRACKTDILVHTLLNAKLFFSSFHPLNR